MKHRSYTKTVFTKDLQRTYTNKNQTETHPSSLEEPCIHQPYLPNVLSATLHPHGVTYCLFLKACQSSRIVNFSSELICTQICMIAIADFVINYFSSKISYLDHMIYVPFSNVACISLLTWLFVAMHITAKYVDLIVIDL